MCRTCVVQLSYMHQQCVRVVPQFVATPSCSHRQPARTLNFIRRFISLTFAPLFCCHFCPDDDDLPYCSSSSRYLHTDGALGGLGDIQLHRSYARYPPCARSAPVPSVRLSREQPQLLRLLPLSMCLPARQCPPVQFPGTHLAVICHTEQHTCFINRPATPPHHPYSNTRPVL